MYLQILEKEVLAIFSTPDESLSPELCGSCLLTVAEISTSLGPHLIPLLPRTLPPVLERVGGEGEEGGCVMMMIAAVTTLGVIVQTLPKFLSSYITDIVKKVQKMYANIIIIYMNNHLHRAPQCTKERIRKRKKEDTH